MKQNKKLKTRHYIHLKRWIFWLVVLTGAVFVGFLVDDELSIGADLSASEASLVEDVAYCDGLPRQKYDITIPAESYGKTPLVVYIHGGGWSSGDKQGRFIHYYKRDVVRAGIAVASVNYRLAPKYRYPIQNQDVACAIAHIARHADRYNIDTKKVIIMGDSAGGLLASMYVLSHQATAPITVRGVVSFYGTTDLVYQLGHFPRKKNNALRYLGTNSDEVARQASPLHQDIKRIPPYLFFHGKNDKTVSEAQALAFYKKIKRLQPASQFVSVYNAGHFFSSKTAPSSAEVRRIMTDFIYLVAYQDEIERDSELRAVFKDEQEMRRFLLID